MEKNSLIVYAKFSGIALQMGGTIFIGAYFGKWLDGIYPMEKKWFTILFTLLGVSFSLYNILRQVNKINEKNDKTE